jgi:hypothetical protein
MNAHKSSAKQHKKRQAKDRKSKILKADITVSQSDTVQLWQSIEALNTDRQLLFDRLQTVDLQVGELTRLKTAIMHEIGGLLADRDRLQAGDRNTDLQARELADLKADRSELLTSIDRLQAAYREMLAQFHQLDLARLGSSERHQHEGSIEISPGYYDDWWCDLSDLTIAKDRLQGRAYWGGSSELAAARKLARSQMPALRGEKFDRPIPCALYIGTPDLIYDRHRRETGILSSLTIEPPQSRHQIHPFKRIHADRSLYFPDMHKGTAVFGAAGSGKSHSVFNPLIRSAIDLGIHTVVYDFKYPEQTQEIAGYAAERGYRVRVFAPAFPESQSLNLLDCQSAWIEQAHRLCSTSTRSVEFPSLRPISQRRCD